MTLTTEQLRERAAAIRCEALNKADQGFVFQSQRLYETAAALDELAANREAQPSITDEAIDRIVVPFSLDGLDEEKHHCEWHLYHDRERIRKELREYFTAPPAPANAQPVAWEMRYWNSGHNCWHDWERITAEQHAEMSVQHATDNDYEFRALYDAPPAPAVSDECAIFEAAIDECRKSDAIDEHAWNHGVLVVMTKFYACRAAMLTQPVSGCYKLNSPVIPDGWIACTERMPDNDETRAIAIYTGKCLGQGMFVGTYDEDGFFDYWEGSEILCVTHWMPLPAAPEGGNG